MSEIELHVVEGTVVEKGVIYTSNNSGGSWWLGDEDWKALAEAGWVVRWATEYVPEYADENGRWLGALATEATRYGLSEDEAIAEWESITGQDANARGCDCCGQPHSFYEEY